MPACIELMREALAEYPRHYRFMRSLAQAIQWNGYNKGIEVGEGAENEEQSEVVRLCERILEDCMDNDIRNATMQILCTAYKNTGQTEKAIKTAKEMPGFSETREWLLSALYDGYKQIEQKQANILFCVWYAAFELSKLAEKSGADEKIMHLEAALKLHETIFYDGNALYYHIWIYHICYDLACCYIQKDTGIAMEYLLMTEKHAAAADAIPAEPAFYTSIFVNKMAHSTAQTLKSSAEPWYGQFFKRLDDKLFEPLFGNPEFAALKERLAAKQQK